MDKLNTVRQVGLSCLKTVKYSLVIVMMFHKMACIPAPPPSTKFPSRVIDAEAPKDDMIIMEDQFVPSTPLIDDCEASSIGSREWTGVVYEIKFGREEPTGVSLGVDIDQRVSSGDDAQSCFRSDLVSPDGEEGIDNQFAKILPLVEAVGGEAIEGLAQGIINQGRLLIMFQLSALDDSTLSNDSCVHFESFYGSRATTTDPHLCSQPFGDKPRNCY